MLGWHQHELHKKCTEICYVELVFSHLVECTSHVVHSGASGAQNMNALFSCLGGSSTDSTKSVVGHIMWNVCFLIRWDL
jgi:hypothetical protein